MSKCEKFGYGVMVTQIAATAPGMVALEKKGKKNGCSSLKSVEATKEGKLLIEEFQSFLL